ncbi:nuclear pore protein 84/107, partial [Thamnocephalis sphaerospora]
VTLPRRERYEYLRQARVHNLDVNAITVAVVQLIFEEAIAEELALSDLQQVSPAFISDPVSAADRTQIRALEWLVYESRQYKEAIVQASALARRFLVNGRINSVNDLLQTLPSDLLSADWTKDAYENDDPASLAVREITGYKNLCDFETHFAQWSVAAKNVKQKQIGSDAVTKARTLVAKLEKLAYPLLTAEWLAFGQPDEEATTDATEMNIDVDKRKYECGRVRELYLTEVTVKLHMVLYESETILPGSMRKSLELGNLVASNDYRLHIEFVRSKRMPELLELLRRSVLALQPTAVA